MYIYILYMYIENVFDRIPRKVWKLERRKKGIREVLAKSVMHLYEGTKIRVIVDYELSEVFEVRVGMHQGSVLSPFLFALVVDVVTEVAKWGVLGELLYADDLVLMSGTITGLRGKFMKWIVGG